MNLGLVPVNVYDSNGEIVRMGREREFNRITPLLCRERALVTGT